MKQQIAPKLIVKHKPPNWMNKMLAKTIIFGSCVLISSLAYATGNNYYPKGCSPKTVKFHGDYVVLNALPSDKEHRVYVFYNTSYYPVRFTHIPAPNKMDSSLPSSLDPNNWSAIVVEQKNFVVACEDDGGYESHLPCHEVVKVCELAVAPVMLSSQGEYWITGSLPSKSSLFSHIRSEGIYP